MFLHSGELYAKLCEYLIGKKYGVSDPLVNTFQEQGSSNLQNITLMRSKILLQRGLENFCPSVYYLITIFTLPVSKVHSCFIIQNFNFLKFKVITKLTH